VLSSIEQVARWQQVAPARACDLMVDTGMNRLGLRPEELGAADGLQIDTLMSHLACADQDHPLNEIQLARFQGIAAALPARRASLANSAGICLGREYSFDLVRPGLALYGGIPRAEADGHIAQVAVPQAQVVQRRIVPPGETIGYGATFTATAETQVAILNLGYADGYWRGFSGTGSATHDGAMLPIVGRVSMDLIAIDCAAAPALREGDWVDIAYDLPTASAASGMSQYELLTGLGGRFDRA
jgi:alanine racemase